MRSNSTTHQPVFKTIWVHYPSFNAPCGFDEPDQDGTVYRLSDAGCLIADAEDAEEDGTALGRYKGKLLREGAQKLLDDGINKLN